MYSITPKKQNKLTGLACLSCFICGVGVFAVSIVNTSLPYLTLGAQLSGILFVTAGIYLYGKFIARTYTYTVQPSGIFDADGRETYDLTVIETTGQRKQRVVCRLGMRDIAYVQSRPMRAAKKSGLGKIKSHRDGGRVFFYCADLVPERVIVVEENDGDVAVLTFDAQLYEILNRNR